MRAIDTNVLVRLITRDDPQQTEDADRFVAKGAWVSHLVLAETMWVLATVYHLKDSDIALTLDMLLTNEALTIQDADVVSAALDQFRKKPKPGFSDFLILEIARKQGHLPLGSFDRDLARISGVERL